MEIKKVETKMNNISYQKEIAMRFEAFGYEYPEESLDQSDLELLGLQRDHPGIHDNFDNNDISNQISSLSVTSFDCPSFEVYGRRYGDPKRKGKSLFCGTYVRKWAVHLDSNVSPKVIYAFLFDYSYHDTHINNSSSILIYDSSNIITFTILVRLSFTILLIL